MKHHERQGSKRSEHELKRLVEEAVAEECRLAGRGLWFCVDRVDTHGHPPERLVVWATLHFLPEGSPFACGEPDCQLGTFIPERLDRIGDHVRRAMGLTQAVRVEFLRFPSPGDPDQLAHSRIAACHHEGVEFLYSTDIDWFGLVDDLKDKGIAFQPGLSDSEIERVERQFRFAFPPDLKEFLKFALPSGDRFPDWRSGTFEDLKRRLDWPLEGICFDIEKNGFWPDDWGARPSSIEAAFAVARHKVESAPVLIPIYAHRYMPDRPHLAFNPVFSVYQTDIIYYGNDLVDYLANEFKIPNPTESHASPRLIEFWSRIASQ